MRNDGGEAVGATLPAEFMQSRLADVRDLTELKLLLCVAWMQGRVAGPGVPLARLLARDVLGVVLAPGSPEPADVRLRRAVDVAVANGTLLRVTLPDRPDKDQILMLATSQNRDTIERLAFRDASTLRALGIGDEEMVTLYRPNIFSLYERKVGPLTPLIAESLRDAERSYPRSWLEQAIDEAVRRNKRSWRYVQAILVEWESTGGRP